MSDEKDLKRSADLEAHEKRKGIGRRELLRRWGFPLLAGLVLGGGGTLLRDRSGRHGRPDDDRLPQPPDWRIDPTESGRLVTSGGASPAENLRRCLDAMGGIERFVRPGEKVVIKPNCAWDRTPAQAANTDPEIVAALARLCLGAGAASVIVVDSTCHDAKRAFERSGIGPAARAAGARVEHQDSVGTTRLDLGGTRLGPWDVLSPIAEADRVINVPLVKHHSLARATMGLKNWIGALVGRRSTLHQRLAQCTAELGAAFRPTLTVVDATRVLTAGGPTGGSLSLVRAVNQVAVATDPVAADSWAGSLLELGTRELPHIEIAARLGLGTADWDSVHERV
ncbi:MAG: DUF362 domain-containing protein [Acidobacteriota bacterium]|nr:MAG: DUF362 domain-containing protein [Acidobacteriota bacterium]